MAWLIRILCIFFGIFIGLGIQQLKPTKGQNATETAIAINQPLTKLSDGESAFDVEKAVKQAVREEMIAQLATIKISPQNCAQAASIVTAQENREINSEKVEIAYDAANHNLDEAIAAGGFSPASARDFIEHLNKLPSDKAFELRLRHVRAINEGLSSAVLPEQAVMMQ